MVSEGSEVGIETMLWPSAPPPFRGNVIGKRDSECRKEIEMKRKRESEGSRDGIKDVVVTG